MENGLISEEFVLNVETNEAAEEETEEVIELPEDAKVSFTITWEGAAALGETAIFTADIEGLDDYEYTMQWQSSADGENWQDADGETGMQMRQVITEENMAYYWRINVTVIGRK